MTETIIAAIIGATISLITTLLILLVKNTHNYLYKPQNSGILTYANIKNQEDKP